MANTSASNGTEKGGTPGMGTTPGETPIMPVVDPVSPMTDPTAFDPIISNPADPLGAPDGDAPASARHRDEARTHFSTAVDEAKAGAAKLREGAEARARQNSDALKDDARDYSEQAKARAADYAVEGKAKASEAIMQLGRVAEQQAPALDEKLGPRYGDYARTASRSLNDAAARLDEKSIEELGEDAREFVRGNPALAVGIAAAAGYMVSRLFSSGRD